MKSHNPLGNLLELEGWSDLYETAKLRVHALLEVGGDGLDRYVDTFIMTLIALNVLAVMLATVDSLYSQYKQTFRIFETFSVLAFTGEYLGRVWACTVDEPYQGPISGRVRFASRPLLIVDMLAILPFYLGAFLVDLRFLRALRLIRFFRLFKLARYSESMKSFGRVIRRKQADLVVTLSATTILILVSSSLMYFAESGAQPDAFSSIPAAIWWGVVTLTTVGYGDVYPITAAGKLLGAIIALLGVGLVALPASILASGFIEEAEGAEVWKQYCPHCGEKLE